MTTVFIDLYLYDKKHYSDFLNLKTNVLHQPKRLMKSMSFFLWLRLLYKLLFVSLFLIHFNVYAQEDPVLNQSETIIKIKKENNPYTQKQTEWLEKNGFQTRKYQWGDQAINSQLDHAIKFRNNGYFLGALGGFATLRGISRIANNSTNPMFSLVIGGASFLLSRNQLKKARIKVQSSELVRLESITVLKDSLFTSSYYPFHAMNPYSQSQSKRMSKRGFSFNNYQWDDERINLHLKKASNQNKIATAFVVGSVGATLLGFMAHIIYATAENTDNTGEYINVPFYVAGGLMMVSTITFSLSNENMKKAVKRRNNQISRKH